MVSVAEKVLDALLKEKMEYEQEKEVYIKRADEIEEISNNMREMKWDNVVSERLGNIQLNVLTNELLVMTARMTFLNTMIGFMDTVLENGGYLNGEVRN